MDTPQTLKKKLFNFMKNDWVFPSDIDGDTLVDEVKDALASTDGVLRDRLAGPSFDKLISQGKVSDEKCRSLYYEIISDKCLLRGLGKEYDDSVFGRAFYGYAAMTLVEYNETVNKRLFGDNDVRDFLSALLKCLSEEKDLRAFDKEKGWAHVVAHTADVLGLIAQNSAIGHDGLLDILYAIKDKICIDHHCYVDGEQFRLATAMAEVLKREIVTEKEFSEWIGSFLEASKTDDPAKIAWSLSNRAEFVMSVQYQLKERPNLRPHTLNALEKLWFN